MAANALALLGALEGRSGLTQALPPMMIATTTKVVCITSDKSDDALMKPRCQCFLGISTA